MCLCCYVFSAALLNNHFVKIGEKLSASLENNLPHKYYMKYLGKRNPCSIILRPTDECEIIDIIRKLNNNKFTGDIHISIVLLEEAKFLIARYLAESFNECLKASHFRNVLKLAKIVNPSS